MSAQPTVQKKDAVQAKGTGCPRMYAVYKVAVSTVNVSTVGTVHAVV